MANFSCKILFLKDYCIIIATIATDCLFFDQPCVMLYSRAMPNLGCKRSQPVIRSRVMTVKLLKQFDRCETKMYNPGNKTYEEADEI
ncbi:MAG: hypothetical protein BGO78_17455 [Chloroflexi bacterium 44-23]|nr:MAG: hypothetical protein BGO78_17455 [Chloroflexi bacterium 44-23]